MQCWQPEQLPECMHHCIAEFQQVQAEVNYSIDTPADLATTTYCYVHPPTMGRLMSLVPQISTVPVLLLWWADIRKGA